MKENNSPNEKKQKYELEDEKKNNVKNIHIQTKREIQTEKKKLSKEKKEKQKLKKEEAKKKRTFADVQVAEEAQGEAGANGQDKDIKKTAVSADKKKENVTASYNGNRLTCGSIKHSCDELLSPKKKIAKQLMEETSTPVNSSTVPLSTPNATSTTKPVYNFEASGINVYQYAESRAYEIMNLKEALKETKFAQNSRVFQTLPRHMRRRAASHDVRRMPKRLRNRFLNEKVEPKKPPSRKYKRRPRNLMEEYNRRSKLHSWLETHMWHAKRFKMIDKWGYRVPEKPCDKAFRAIYRASAQSCLLQDKSYMEFIEVIGAQQVIIKGFERMTSSNAIGGISLSDDKCLSGQCYGEEIIYTHDSYPYNVIGHAKFIWTDDVDTCNRKLIVVCHPTISSLIMNELHVVFDVNKMDDDGTSTSSNVNLGSSRTNELTNLPDQGEVTDGNTNVKMEDDVSVLQDKIKLIHHKLDFIVFSLTGPLSFQILQRTFTLKGEKENVERGTWNLPNGMSNGRCSIHNLLVEDPRYHIPYKKQDPFSPSPDRVESPATGGVSLPTSLIWNESSRKKVTEEKLTDEEINKMRQQQLIPGSTLPVKSAEIPVIVMQRPARSLHCNSQEDRKYGGGFDMILPSGWAMPFWIALVYQGARVGGVESDENIALEATSIHFPTLFPDSKVRQEEVVNLHEERLQKHYRYPPDKRMNYDKLGFKHPFTVPWIHLVEEWKNIIKFLMPEHKDLHFRMCDQGMYVLREKKLLHQLRMLLNGHTELQDEESIMSSLMKHPDSVVLVNVSPVHEGTPCENATLCIPSGEDLALVNLSRGELDGRLTEPRHKGYKRDFPYICKKHDILLPNAATVGGNTRWIVGFVQKGGYSYTKGKGKGIGFISTIAFAYLLSLKKGSKLLFRNTNTLDYLFSTVDVLL